MKPETLQLLRDERDELAQQAGTLAQQVETLDGVISALTGTGFTVMPALKRALNVERPTGRKKRGDRGRNAEKAEARPEARASGKMAARRAPYIAAIEKCGETFSVEEVIERGKLVFTPKVVNANLCWWTKKGILTKADKGVPSRGMGGTWRRGLGWRKFAGGAAKAEDGGRRTEKLTEKVSVQFKPIRKPKQVAAPTDAPRKAPPAMAGIGPGMRLSRTAGKHGQSPQMTALEALFAGLSGAYSGPEIVEMVRKHWPDLVDSPSKVSDLRVRLMDMFTAGKIRRTGIGTDSRFSALPGRPPTAAADDDLKISVPRDVDVGGDK